MGGVLDRPEQATSVGIVVEGLHGSPVIAIADAASARCGIDDVLSRSAVGLGVVGAEKYVDVLGIGLEQLPVVPEDVWDGAGLPPDARGPFVVVLDVQLEGEASLVGVAQAGRPARLFPRPGEYGEDQCGKDRDKGDHDEQFDQCKSVSGGAGHGWNLPDILITRFSLILRAV